MERDNERTGSLPDEGFRAVAEGVGADAVSLRGASAAAVSGKVVAFPDIDGYDEWVRKLADYPDLGVTVSPVLQRSATPEDREVHIDIADWLLRDICSGRRLFVIPSGARRAESRNLLGAGSS